MFATGADAITRVLACKYFTEQVLFVEFYNDKKRIHFTPIIDENKKPNRNDIGKARIIVLGFLDKIIKMRVLDVPSFVHVLVKV